jgi:hypothetical protein
MGENENFCENFCENKKLMRKLSQNEILRKVSEFSLMFAFRENEKRGFRFNPKLTLFINMLKLDEITISESRVAKPKSQGTESFSLFAKLFAKAFAKIFVCAKVFANIFVFSKPSAKN